MTVIHLLTISLALALGFILGYSFGYTDAEQESDDREPEVGLDGRFALDATALVPRGHH